MQVGVETGPVYGVRLCVCERETQRWGSRRVLGALIKNSLPCSLVLGKQYEDVAIVWIESAH